MGAILRYAVEDRISGIDLQTVGLILIIAGVVGFLVGLAIAMGARDRGTVVRDPRDPYERRDPYY